MTDKKKQKTIVNLIFLFILTILSIQASFELSNTIDMSDMNKNGAELSPTQEGSVSSNDYDIFWFIHVTDTQHIWYSDEKREWFDQFLDESYTTIMPEFIYNTGDIVDSDYEHFITQNDRDQRVEEWERYREALENSNMSSDIYMDVMGNHDAYGDPGFKYFLKYSMMGSTYNKLQHAFKRSFSFGDYAFIGLHTPEDYGIKYPHALFGYLNAKELDWYEEQLEKYEDCERIFIFGHHPPYEINSEVNSNGKTFFMLNDEYGVDYYFMGHGHINSFDKINDLIAIETTKFDNDGGSYRIVALDKNELSTSLEFVNEWPQAVITYPPRNLYINENLNKEDLDTIRVLAWDPKGIDSVKWCAYDESGKTQITDWKSMANATNEGPLYVAKWNDDLNDGTKYTIKVKIEGGSGKSTKEIIFFSLESFYFGWQIGYPLIVFSFIALVALILLSTYYKRAPLKAFKKAPEAVVDPQLKKLFLLKLLIFLVAPVTLAGMYIGQITVVFPFFFANLYGIHYSSLNLLFTGVTFMFSLFWVGQRLSYKHRKRLIIHLFISIAFLGFLMTFYILHYPILSWCSPGLYGMVIIDAFMIKRNVEMRKKRSKST
ncbi:MAG: metallophosphoesterase [Promethearchaeota archaeon]